MNDNSALATSKDIRPDFAKTINSNEKKALVDLMNREFESQRVVFDQQVREKQREALDKHRTKAQYDRLKKTHDDTQETLYELKERKRKEMEEFRAKQNAEIEIVENKLERAKQAIWNTGFDIDGDLVTRGYGCEAKKEAKAKAEKIQAELDEIKNKIYPAENQKNKYTALLWACSTQGEAMVIMREVLGNGVIPEIKKTDLPYNNRQLTDNR